MNILNFLNRWTISLVHVLTTWKSFRSIFFLREDEFCTLNNFIFPEIHFWYVVGIWSEMISRCLMVIFASHSSVINHCHQGLSFTSPYIGYDKPINGWSMGYRGKYKTHHLPLHMCCCLSMCTYSRIKCCMLASCITINCPWPGQLYNVCLL